MEHNLMAYEWEFLIHLLNGIYSSDSSAELFDLLYTKLSKLIDFDMILCLRLQPGIHRPKITACYLNSHRDDVDLEGMRQITLTEPRSPWLKYVASNQSNVFRQSDYVPLSEWENNYNYLRLWKPNHIYYGLFLSIVCNDEPQLIIGLLREKKRGNFNERDASILDLMTETLETKFSISFHPSSARNLTSAELRELLESYGLTHREVEITDMIYRKCSSNEICEKLCISPSTINKHLSNIYKKTGTINRVSLFAFLHEQDVG